MDVLHTGAGDMKCLLVASESAEVLFYWTDPEFQLRVQEQYGPTRHEDGRVRPMLVKVALSVPGC